MARDFSKLSDEQLYRFLEENCPEGQLFDAVDELVERFEFYKMILTDVANAAGLDLDQFIEQFDEEPLEDMNLEDVVKVFDKACGGRAKEKLIEAIRKLRGE